jgi:hypothetical protein
MASSKPRATPSRAESVARADRGFPEALRSSSALEPLDDKEDREVSLGTRRQARVGRNLLFEGGPALVYHYTTMEGFRGIFESRALRATHLFFQNDASEFDTARECAREALTEFAASAAPSRIRGDLRRVLERLGPRYPQRVYSFSFSHLRDDLNLWRAYSRGGGVAIGIPRLELEAHVRRHGVLFGRCEYDAGRSRERMGAIVEEALAAFRGKSAARPSGWTLVDEVEFQLDFQGSLLKNALFWSEQEWRCLAFPEATTRPFRECFRVHGGKLVPFIEIPLPPAKRERFWSNVRVVLSPEASGDLENLAVRRFLESAVGREIEVLRSRVPLSSVAA